MNKDLKFNENKSMPNLRQLPDHRPTPKMLHEAGVPLIQKSYIDIDQSDDNRGLFDGLRINQNNLIGNQSASTIVRLLTRYVTRKYADDVSIKMLIDQEKNKEKVFENIF